MNYLKYAVAVLILSGIMSCKKDPVAAVDWKYEYFQNTVGQWVIYDVDSIKYDDFNLSVDTIEYQVRDIIESQFLNESGQLTNRIERYRRDSVQLPWTIMDVYTSNLLTTRAEVVEENLRFIKLIFPPRLGNTWAGNSFINSVDDLDWLDGWEYEYTAMDVGMSLGGISFDSTLTVAQVNDKENLLRCIFGEEIYAKHVGMISKKLIHLERETFTGDFTSGFILQFTVDSFGN